MLCEIDGDRCCRCHASRESVRWESACIVNGIVGLEVFELFSRWSNEHVPHEQGMVCARADDANIDSESLVPAGVAIDDIYSISCVQVVDSALTVDAPYLMKGLQLAFDDFTLRAEPQIDM